MQEKTKKTQIFVPQIAQMDSDFYTTKITIRKQKYAALQKYKKNKELFLFFAQMNAANCIGERKQNKRQQREMTQ